MTPNKKTKRKTREEKELMKGYNPLLGITEGKFRTHIVSNMRELFRNTRRASFIRDTRIEYRGPKSWTHYVTCANPECEKQMGHTEKFRPRSKVTGALAKKERSIFDVDHIEGLPQYKTLEDLTEYALALFYGPLQTLCYECHQDKTLKLKNEAKERI